MAGRAAFLAVLAVAGAAAAMPAFGARAAGPARRCADVDEGGGQTATHVVATGVRCRLARQGVETYLGSPQGCLTSVRCEQSGVDDHPDSLVRCRRRGHRVRCEIVIRRPRGSVRFVVHPIGYPGVRGTRP